MKVKKVPEFSIIKYPPERARRRACRLSPSLSSLPLSLSAPRRDRRDGLRDVTVVVLVVVLILVLVVVLPVPLPLRRRELAPAASAVDAPGAGAPAAPLVRRQERAGRLPRVDLSRARDLRGGPGGSRGHLHPLKFLRCVCLCVCRGGG